MEYFDVQSVQKHREIINSVVIPTLQEICNNISRDSIILTTNEINNISSELIISKYQKDAENRNANQPDYLKEAPNKEAKNRANSYLNLINKLRSCTILARIPKKFKISSDKDIIYDGDLEKEITRIFTRKLTPKQEKYVETIQTFINSFDALKNMLTKIKKPAFIPNIKVPLTDNFGQPDLSVISLIDIDDDAENEKLKMQIAASKKKKEEREKRLNEILELIPFNVPDRQEEAERLLHNELFSGQKQDSDWIKRQYKKYDV